MLDKGPKPPNNDAVAIETALYNRQTAAAEARLAAINADLAADKARFGTVSPSGLSGSVTTANGAGNSEATLLAARALESAAAIIAGKVTAIAGSKSVVVVAGTQPLSFGYWEVFQIQSDLVGRAFDRAKRILTEAEKLASQTSGSDDVFTLLRDNKPLDIETHGIVGGATTRSIGKTGFAGLATGGLVTGAGAALDLASKLASYFQTDYQWSGATVSGIDDSTLALSVAGRLPNAHFPSLWSGTSHIRKVAALLEPLTDMSSDLFPAVAAAQEKSRALKKALATEKDEETKIGMTAVSAAYDRGIDAFNAGLKSLDAVVSSLAAPDKDGMPAAMKVLNEQKLASLTERSALVLFVKLAASVGSSYTKKYLGATIMGYVPFFVSGGVVVEHMLVDGKSGRVWSSGQIPMHGGYYAANALPDQINGVVEHHQSVMPMPMGVAKMTKAKLATVTTTDGDELTFAVARVCALTDHDVATGAAVTCIFGISAGAVRTAEEPMDFLNRLLILPHFAKLTKPNNYPVWISAEAVVLVRPPEPGEYDAAVRTVVVAGSVCQGVVEDNVAVTAAIKGCGGAV